MSGQTKSLRERFYTEEEKKAWFAALLIMLAGAVIIFGHEYYTVMKLMKSILKTYILNLLPMIHQIDRYLMFLKKYSYRTYIPY